MTWKSFAISCGAGALVTLMLMMGSAHPAAQMPVVNGGFFQPRSHATVSLGATTALSLPATTIAPSGDQMTVCFLSVETQAIRYWLDGAAPTASVGHLVAPGSSLTLQGASALQQFQVISTTGTATLQVSCAR